MAQGIYGIYDGDELLYVGQSRSIESRWNVHKSKLARGIHDNGHLQSHFNKYSRDLDFRIIEDVDDESALTEREIFYIRTLCPSCNMNIPDKNDTWTVTEEKRKSLSDSHKGYVMPDEQKEKIRASNLISQNTDDAKRSKREALAKRNRERARTVGYGTFGKHLSQDTKNKISASNRARWNALSEEEKEIARQKIRDGIAKSEFVRHSGHPKERKPVIAKMIIGPDGKRHLAEESKAALSTINKERFKDDDERKRTSDAVKAALKRPEVQEKIIRARERGVSDETRAKMSLAKRGKKQSPESVKKRADANRGKRYDKGPAPFTVDEWYEMRKTMSVGDIKKKYGVSDGRLNRWRDMLGIPKRIYCKREYDGLQED